jgi:hypothetical protein
LHRARVPGVRRDAHRRAGHLSSFIIQECSKMMRSRRSFLHLGFLAAATLAIPAAGAAPAYHGSARGSGLVTARDDAGRTFTIVARRGRGRASTYHVTDTTRFILGGAPGTWEDVKTGALVQVRWHRAADQRVAHTVGITARPRH